jgi:hypothetical protein
LEQIGARFHLHAHGALIPCELTKRTRNFEQDLHQPDFPRLTLFVRAVFRLFGIFDFKFGFVVGAPSMWTTAAFTHKICGNPSTIFFQLFPSSLDP